MSSPVHKIKKEPTPKSLPNLKTEKERGRRRLRLRGRRRVREREGEKELLSAAPETQKLKKNNMDSLFFLASPLILLVHVCTWIRSLRLNYLLISLPSEAKVSVMFVLVFFNIVSVFYLPFCKTITSLFSVVSLCQWNSCPWIHSLLI